MAVYSYARLGKARLKAFRLGYRQPSVVITINGVDRLTKTRIEGLSIRDYLDGQPNIATMRVDGFTPTQGHEIKIGLGSLQPSCLIFAGHIQMVTQVYEADNPRNIAFDLTCISYEWLLNRRKVNGRFLSMSATNIVTSLMGTFTSGFTTVNVAAGLDELDEITFTNEDMTDALDRIAKRVGAYWLVDYNKDLHFFVDAPGAVHDVTTGDAKTAAGINATSDLSQVRTRVYYQGGGSNTPIAVDAGSTLMPVDDGVWYDASGGLAQVGPQRVTYTGVQGLTGGAIVGTSAVPANAPTLATATGTGLGAGVYQYAITFVTASGETTAGPSASVTTRDMPAPAGAITAANEGTNGTFTTVFSAGDSVYYVVTFINAAGETTGGTSQSNTVTAVAYLGGCQVIHLTNIPVSSDPSVTGKRVYRYVNGVSQGYRAETNAQVIISNDGQTNTAGSVPVSNTASERQVSLTAIQVGPTGTTSRKVYRTVVAGAQLKLQSTIANNTATTLTDSTADGSLGVNVPTSNTSALVQDSGQVNALASAVAVTGSGDFASGGGYARIGSQVIRYTGVTSTTLTGVPASGDGALGASVRYGQEILPVPCLTGIPSSGAGSVLYTVPQGEAVNVVAQADDAAAQTAMASYTGGDGIVEETEQDQRLSLAEAQNRADATLEVLKDPLVTMRYTTRDQATRTGYEVTFALDAPTSIAGTFKIQAVTIADFDARGLRWPTRQVEASTRRLTLENILRLIKAA